MEDSKEKSMPPLAELIARIADTSSDPQSDDAEFVAILRTHIFVEHPSADAADAATKDILQLVDDRSEEPASE